MTETRCKIAQKTKRISFRITQEQYEKLLKETEAAQIPNGNISEYLRRQAELYNQKDLIYWEGMKEIQYQIRKIGLNINQIVRRNNSRLYFKSDKEELVKDLKEIQKLLKELQRKEI